MFAWCCCFAALFFYVVVFLRGKILKRFFISIFIVVGSGAALLGAGLYLYGFYRFHRDLSDKADWVVASDLSFLFVFFTFFLVYLLLFLAVAFALKAYATKIYDRPSVKKIGKILGSGGLGLAFVLLVASLFMDELYFNKMAARYGYDMCLYERATSSKSANYMLFTSNEASCQSFKDKQITLRSYVMKGVSSQEKPQAPSTLQ